MTNNGAAEILKSQITRDDNAFDMALAMAVEALELLEVADTEDCPEISRGSSRGWFRYTEYGETIRHETLIDALRAARAAGRERG